MELKDLNVLALQLQAQFKEGFVADDIELPEYFKNKVAGAGEYTFSYKKHTVHLKSSSLDGYIPNSWFFIASYFVDYYNELQNYKSLLIETLIQCGLSAPDDRDEIMARFPKLVASKSKALDKTQKNQAGLLKCQDEASEEVKSDLNRLFATSSISQINKDYLIKFVSDYRWWYGGKTIDRGDFYVSPVLTLANVVNASHSYIADLCKFLASEKEAAAVLRHQNAIFVESSLPAFFVGVFKHFYQNEDKLKRIFEHLIPGSSGSCRYAYDYNGLRQTNFFIKGDDNFMASRKGDFNKFPYSYLGENYYLSQELTKQRTNSNEVSFYGLKPILESHYKEYTLIEESEVYILLYNGMKHLQNAPHQQIFYGAPGTGKSHKVKEVTDELPKSDVFRTTFHPDSDYSTFVGCYKPKMVKAPIRDGSGHEITSACEDEKKRIAYEYEPQAFLKAYVRAYETSEPVFLVIEEINRGNCAQIFGDMFQLLDRNENGESDYAIKPETAIQEFLNEKLKDCDIEDETIKSGEEMRLPANLHIWATMNTSDQSLFPIDSAFKRRWDWKYMPIDYNKEKWSIVAKGEQYSWSDFLKKINNLVASLTDSEDKMLGFYFAKAKDGIIDADTFVGKVVFYLWNDLFKDYGLPKEILKGAESKEFAFRNFFMVDGHANEDMVKRLLDNLEVAKLTDTDFPVEGPENQDEA